MKSKEELTYEIKELTNLSEIKNDDIQFCNEWLATIFNTHETRKRAFQNGDVSEESFKLSDIEFRIEANDISRKIAVLKSENEIMELDIALVSNDIVYLDDKSDIVKYENRKQKLLKKKETSKNLMIKNYSDNTDFLLELQKERIEILDKMGRISIADKIEQYSKITKKATVEKDSLKNKFEPKEKALTPVVPSIQNHSSR